MALVGWEFLSICFLLFHVATSTSALGISNKLLQTEEGRELSGIGITVVTFGLLILTATPRTARVAVLAMDLLIPVVMGFAMYFRLTVSTTCD